MSAQPGAASGKHSRARSSHAGFVAAIVLALSLGSVLPPGGAALARESVAAAPAAADWTGPTVASPELPREARGTLKSISAGGPYRFSKDGVVFGNFERLLPRRPRGYYHEYTVRTPGARNRGARRIVCGGPPRQIDNCFYSDDHYTSFKRIIE